MADDIQAIKAIFNDEQALNSKKFRSKKQLFLMKFNLFTLIYQKKGQSNFNEIVTHIRISQYGLAEDIIKDTRERFFTFIISGFVLVFTQKIDEPGSPPTLYKKMGAGDHFGQKLMFSSILKLHSAKSVGKTYVFELDLQTFYKTFSGHFKYQQLKEKVSFLQNIWIFQQTNQNQIQRILLLSKPYRYTKNTIIFKEDQSPQFAYVVIEGQLTLYKKDRENGRFVAFMILGKNQISCSEQILEKSVMRFRGVITSSQAVLLKINKNLFLDIFQHKVNFNVLNERKEIKQKLIQQKSKSSIDQSLKKLNQFEKSRRTVQTKRRYKTQPKQTVQTGDIFDIKDGSISWQNRLKNRKLRQFILKQKVAKQKQSSAALRLSTTTNNSFTNDKELLLSYLIRKQKRQKKAEDWEHQFQKQSIFLMKDLVVTNSSAVKNHKRKLKQSRKKNTVSMPFLN